MKGVSFTEKTAVFGKPDGWKDEDCYSLPVAQTVYENSDGSDVPCLVSCWELSEEEIAEIIRTKRMYLSITGGTMPPVSLMVENPFPDNYDKEQGVTRFRAACAGNQARSAISRNPSNPTT